MTTDIDKRFVVVTDDDLCWGFRKSECYFRTKHFNGDSGHTVEVDPTPCYPHDAALAKEWAVKVEAAFPIGAPPMWHIAPREEEGRTNGWASTSSVWSDELDGWDEEYYIVLAGKRIPPHPAMTRYLCAHEYGHVVDYWMCRQETGKNHTYDIFDEEYAKLRGLVKKPKYYGPGSWHENVGELIANDFRIIMCKAEREFWPHPGIPRPENFPKLRRWWLDKFRKFSA